MAKKDEPSIAVLQAKIERLEEALAFEKDINRKMLDLPEDTPAEEIKVPWLTEWMQQETDAHEITSGAVTQVYNQLVWKLLRLKNGLVIIHGHDGKLAKKRGQKYKMTQLKLEADSFFLLLELMQFAANKLDMSRDEVIASLTDGKGIKVKQSLVGF